MDASTMQHWVESFKYGNRDIADLPHSGRSGTATTEFNEQKVDDVITGARNVAVIGIVVQFDTGHCRAGDDVKVLGYRKVCCRWVPLLMMGGHKRQAWMYHRSCFHGMLPRARILEIRE
jgi:hypothetical protein